MKRYLSQKVLGHFAMTAAVLVTVLALAVPALEASARPVDRGQAALGAWTLQWSDEFNGSGGVSGANWIYDTGTGYGCGSCANWGTGEVESMSTSTANVNQTGGHLAITPIHSGSNPTAGWTSGRIETQRTDFQPPSGGGMAIEASIQQPNVSGAGAAGYWPAFWALGAPFRGVYTNWPSVGEIDIMEDINGLSSLFGTLHCGTSPGGQCNETTGIGSGQRACSGCQAGYHTYRFEFDKSVSPQQMRWYLDGANYFTVNANQVDATTWSNATNHGFFVIFDVAMGGGFPAAFGGGPTASTVSGVPMNVDWVRVYYANAAGGATATRTRTPTVGGPTATRTRTPTAGGPTATRTRTPTTGASGCTGNTGSEYTYGVTSSGASTALVCFKPTGFTAGYVIVHYIVANNVQQNVQMTYNAGTARWEYTVPGINSGQQLRYQYTYQKSGLQYDTAWFTWTKP